MTESEKVNLLCTVSEACDLRFAIHELGEALETQYQTLTMEMSVCDGHWRIVLSREGFEGVEGGGYTLAQAILATFPYLDQLEAKPLPPLEGA